eukprot:5505382-Amphidinium_carterae.1
MQFREVLARVSDTEMLLHSLRRSNARGWIFSSVKATLSYQYCPFKVHDRDKNHKSCLRSRIGLRLAAVDSKLLQSLLSVSCYGFIAMVSYCRKSLVAKLTMQWRCGARD